MTAEAGKQIRSPISVAPMMDWTDRHCRYFMRLLSPNAMLYTEMITAAAIHYGDRDRLLGFDAAEHPIAALFALRNEIPKLHVLGRRVDTPVPPYCEVP